MKLIYCIVLLQLLLGAVFSNAHTIEGTTAKVILREGQVEMQIQLDLEKWKATLVSNERWLLGDIKQVMPANLTFSQQKHFMSQILENESILKLNDQVISMSVAHFSELDHHGYVTVVLYTKHTLAEVHSAQVTWSKSLGPVHTNIVKPHYRLISPGHSTQVSF